MSNAPFSLQGRVALVTGGTGAIGSAIVAEFLSAGAQVAFTGRRPELQVPSEVDGGVYLRGDSREDGAVKAAVAEVVARFGRFDILVNNAGVARDALLLRTNDELWAEMMETNLRGVFLFCREATRHLLKAREAGRIINISSIVAERGNAGQAAYAASKAGILGLTRALARELGSRGITVNAVAPGFIDSPMTARSIDAQGRADLELEIPLRRMGRCEDVAHMVRFLASPEAGYVTGQVLRVNGGLQV
ncbi:MAG: 3-oxoacyl-ACP reductase FabG [Deltaproteobacteria bacterium]|nr:3-oxoacyl-ACP reductase FabG [Deltaproteobacteria bacterium]